MLAGRSPVFSSGTVIWQIGQYAQQQYLVGLAKRNLTETVHAFGEYLPSIMPLVHPSPPGGGRAALTRLSELLRSEADRDGAGSAAIMSALCVVLIALVLRTNGATDAHSRLWTAVSDPRLSRIIQNVVARPEEHWSIERLSTEVAMSRVTFIRLFQASTGMTFGQFVTRVRLMTAADLLVNTDQKIAWIAAQIGYKSESTFTRAFRAATGESPSRFR